MGYVGFKLGLGFELVKLIGLGVGLCVGFRYYQEVGDGLAWAGFLGSAWASAFTMGALVMLGYLATTWVLRWMEKGVQVGFQQRINQIGGLGAGLFRGLLAASVVLVICQQLPSGRMQESIGERSLSGPAVSRVAPAVYDALSALPGRLLRRMGAK